MKSRSMLRLHLEGWYPWVLAVLAVLFGHWTAVSIHSEVEHLFAHWIGIPWLLAVGYTAALVIVVVLLYRERSAFFHPHTRHISSRKEPPRRAHLVLFLSPLSGTHTETRGIPDFFKPTGDLIEDIRTLSAGKEKDPSKRWLWEMPLRGIMHHIERNRPLKTVTLICSRESITQIEWFSELISEYGQASLQGVSFHTWVKRHDQFELLPLATTPANPDSGFCFEDFDELSTGLITLLKTLMKRCNAREREIMIDITGGQKVNSVVAAAVTFNRSIQNQYVRTNHPWNVIGLNIQMGAADVRGLELPE